MATLRSSGERNDARRSIVEMQDDEIAKQELKTDLALFKAEAAQEGWEQREEKLQRGNQEIKEGIGRLRSMLRRQDSATQRFEEQFGQAKKNLTSTVYERPIVTSSNIFGSTLQGDHEDDRIEHLEEALQMHAGVPSFGRVQAMLDEVAFSEPPSGVIGHACHALKVSTSNVYDSVQKILARFPSDRVAMVKDTFDTFVAELRGSVTAVSIINDCASTCQDELDDAQEELNRLRQREQTLKSALAESMDALTKLKEQHEADLEAAAAAVANSPQGRGIKAVKVLQMCQVTSACRVSAGQLAAMTEKAESLLRGTEDEENGGIFLAQIESAAFLKKSAGATVWREGLKIYAGVLGSVAETYEGRLIFPLTDRQPGQPSEGEKEELTWEKWAESSPDLTSVVFTTPRTEQAVWFAVELQRALLKAQWPENLLRYAAVQKRRSLRPSEELIAPRANSSANGLGTLGDPLLWGGLRVRCAVHVGYVPCLTNMRTVEDVPALRRCSKVLALARGGECLATSRLWDEYDGRSALRNDWSRLEIATADAVRGEEMRCEAVPRYFRFVSEDLQGRWKPGQFNDAGGRFPEPDFYLPESGQASPIEDTEELSTNPILRVTSFGRSMVRGASHMSGGSVRGSPLLLRAGGGSVVFSTNDPQRRKEAFKSFSAGLASFIGANSGGIFWYLERAECQLMSLHDVSPEGSVQSSVDSQAVATVALKEQQSSGRSPVRPKGNPIISIEDTSAKAVFTRAMRLVRQSIKGDVTLTSASSEGEFCAKHLHRVARLLPEILQRMQRKDVTALNGEQAVTLFAQHAQLPDMAESKQPWRGKFNVIVSRALDTEDFGPGRLLESAVAHLAKVLMQLKSFKRSLAVETNKRTNTQSVTTPRARPGSASPTAASKRSKNTQFHEFGMMHRQRMLQERWQKRKGDDTTPPPTPGRRASEPGPPATQADVDAAAATARQLAQEAAAVAAGLLGDPPAQGEVTPKSDSGPHLPRDTSAAGGLGISPNIPASRSPAGRPLTGQRPQTAGTAESKRRQQRRGSGNPADKGEKSPRRGSQPKDLPPLKRPGTQGKDK